jgi:O-antigen/teichoic acid export membrane protein
MLVLLSLSVIPALLLDGYKGILLANGNSRGFTVIIVFSAIVKTVLLIVMIQKFGIVGAIVAPFLSEFVTYPVLVHYIRPYRGWHPALDMLLLSVGIAIIVIALWLSPAATELLVTALRGV